MLAPSPLPNEQPNLFGHLSLRNGLGANIYVSIDSIDNLAGEDQLLHCFFTEFSGRLPKSFPLPPTLTIATSKSTHQCYWGVDGLTVAEFEALSDRFVKDYGATRNALQPTSLLSAPGFINHSADGFATHILFDERYTSECRWPDKAEFLQTRNIINANTFRNYSQNRYRFKN